MGNWFQKIIEWDISLQQHINQNWTNGLLDFWLPLLRNPLFWLPLYLFFIFWLIRKYRHGSWAILGTLVLLVIISDAVSAQLLKPWINRLRPCWDENTAATVRMLTGCGGRFSFPSNHAVNHFAMAMFVFLTIKKTTTKAWWLLFVWAAAICYAQVYVGKHFPLDVIGGAGIGSIFGWLLFMGGNRMIQLRIPAKTKSAKSKKQFVVE